LSLSRPAPGKPGEAQQKQLIQKVAALQNLTEITGRPTGSIDGITAPRFAVTWLKNPRKGSTRQCKKKARMVHGCVIKTNAAQSLPKGYATAIFTSRTFCSKMVNLLP